MGVSKSFFLTLQLYIDAVWGDLVQKLCQICRKSESSVMSACEWSSELRLFFGTSEIGPFDKRTSAWLENCRPRRKIPLPRRGFEHFDMSNKKQKKFTCHFGDSHAGQSRLVWIPWCDGLRVEMLAAWNLWNYWARSLFRFFCAVHKDQTCWAIVWIFHFVSRCVQSYHILLHLSKLYIYLIFFETCNIPLWLSSRFNGKRQKNAEDSPSFKTRSMPCRQRWSQIACMCLAVLAENGDVYQSASWLNWKETLL